MSEMRLSKPNASAAHLSPKQSESGQNLDQLPWEATVELISRSRDILLICHVSPDGDAIGSLLGLGLGLSVLGKRTTLACESPPPRKFAFLRGFESIVDSVDVARFDVVIGLDSSDPARLGNIYDAHRMDGIPLINIDHHVTNLFFGDVNLVDPSAASTAEIVLTLLGHLGISMDDDQTLYQPTPSQEGMVTEIPRAFDIATCLLTGMVTDTLGFRTSNVTPKVMDAAVQVMQAGASLSQVTHFSFHQRPLVELSLLTYGLNRLQTEDGLAWSEISLADRQACGHKGNGDAGLVGMLARTKEIQIAAVFTEKEDNQVEIGFRADPGFDVAQLALSLGGGGHPAASGCTIAGPLEAAKARVLPLLRATLEEQKKSEGF